MDKIKEDVRNAARALFSDIAAGPSAGGLLVRWRPQDTESHAQLREGTEPGGSRQGRSVHQDKTDNIRLGRHFIRKTVNKRRAYGE